MVLRLGVAGLGTVGVALIKLLDSQRTKTLLPLNQVALTAVSARARNKDRGVDLSSVAWFSDPMELAKSDKIDVFIELIGGSEGAARASVFAAIEAKKPVITANKALLAAHGNEIARMADEHKVPVLCEAAVAGGIPILKPLRESLCGNELSRITGILNGTCNYILTQMEEKKQGFETCLAEAQQLGYAEADPTFDIEGWDAAHKLAILTSLAFGSQVDANAISVRGITSITLSDIEAARELGYRIKLLATSVRTNHGIEQMVHPALVRKSRPIAGISGVTNAVLVEGDAVGSAMFVGPGAGGEATASSVLGDIADVLAGRALPVFGKPYASLVPFIPAPMRAHEGGYFIRMDTLDKPGVMKAITGYFADEDISLRSIAQNISEGAQSEESDTAEVILITHRTTEQAVESVVEKLNTDGIVASSVSLIRIEP